MLKLDDGKYGLKPEKKVRVWASLAAKTLAEDLGITEADITERTGKNGVIVLADVKNAYKQKQGATIEPAKEKKTKPKAKKTKEPVPPPPPEPESESEDEGSEFEDE